MTIGSVIAAVIGYGATVLLVGLAIGGVAQGIKQPHRVDGSIIFGIMMLLGLAFSVAILTSVATGI